MKNKKTKYIELFMKCVDASAEMSYGRKAKVGAILVKDNRIIVNSWNGTPSGFDNNCEDLIDNKLVTKNIVVHAEANALIFAAKNGICTNNSDLYISLSPCINCALLIIQAGIKNVYYKQIYKKPEGLDLLKKSNINTFHVLPTYETE